MSHLFSPLELRTIKIPNRIAVSPMCMYSCENGFATNWHMVHLGSRAVGGAGLVLTEATAVTAVGRITSGDLGIWSDEHADALRPIAEFISSQGSVPGVQLAHAGRKGGRTPPWEGNHPIPTAEWGTLPAPSAIPFQPDWSTPEAMTEAAMEELVRDFAAAARRSHAAGFKVIEAHFAHGYLLHQFLSPLSNHRVDEYGGSLENRARLPLRIIRALREAWPDELPLIVRLSIVDWAPGGITIDETIQLCIWLREAGVDLVDCSSGAVVPGETVPVAPGYHAPMTSRIRSEAGIATGAVGMIWEPQIAERVLADGDADIVLLARAMLKDPYWPRHAAEFLQANNAVEIPIQYRRAVARMSARTQW